jgi:D-3-phosphoglycerate dehydrogenase
MKDGVRIINLARAELVDSEAMIAAVKSGKVAAYVTDFITDELIGADDRIVCIPHLGASTEESEDKCAVMAAKEIIDYLENGNIKNSVNFPNVQLPHSGDARICLMHRNVAGVLSTISTAVAELGINIENMLSRSRGDYAYTVLEIKGDVPEEALNQLRAMDAMIRIRVIR